MCDAKLTWEVDALHLLSVATAQPYVELLEFRVAPSDDGWGFIAATGLDHMDGVKLAQTHTQELHYQRSAEMKPSGPVREIPTPLHLTCFVASMRKISSNGIQFSSPLCLVRLV